MALFYDRIQSENMIKIVNLSLATYLNQLNPVIIF